jgi:alcohol dehydrogenase class IV
MTASFTYCHPTEIRFGAGRVQEVGSQAARFGRRCLLVTAKAWPDIAPVYERVKASLRAAGLEVAHFDGVRPNPTTAVVTEGATLARQHQADVIVGLGGGSSMDTAKAIAVEATHPGTSWDYLFYKTPPGPHTLPVIAVTTTSGTGSQVTQVAVVTNTERRDKSALYNSLLFPRVAIVDPELMLTAPAHLTAATGFDAFTHAFESFLHVGASPYTDMMALEAIRLVAAHLPSAVHGGSDLLARSALAWADTLAGLCIASAGVTLPHGIGMAIGGMYPHVMHGEALAVVYPAIARFSWASAPRKYAALARILEPALGGLDDAAAAERCADAIVRFQQAIALALTLEGLKVPREELPALAEQSMVLPDYKNHPVAATREQVLALLEESYRPHPPVEAL